MGWWGVLSGTDNIDWLALQGQQTLPHRIKNVYDKLAFTVCLDFIRTESLQGFSFILNIFGPFTLSLSEICVHDSVSRWWTS